MGLPSVNEQERARALVSLLSPVSTELSSGMVPLQDSNMNPLEFATVL